MCEVGLQLPPLNDTFWNRCMSAVSEATEGSGDYDPAVDPASQPPWHRTVQPCRQTLQGHSGLRLSRV
ncbi:hypothetical protein ABBQ38_009864 [Trebouxia sp. C0009 RCD-2024]